MSMMDQEIILLLRKYVSNTCTTQELDVVKHLLKSGQHDHEWQAVLQEAAEVDMADDSEVINFDSFGVFDKINSSIQPVRPISYPWWIGIAASLLIMCSVVYLIWKPKLHQSRAMTQLSIITDAGQQKKIVLSDGSEVMLNCGSSLRYTSGFIGKNREVYLNGEAFFKVVHDPAHPFIVHTNRVKVQVLGTSFNVRAYATDANSAISVATGKVGVSGHKTKAAYLLLPGDQLSLNRSNEFEKRHASIEDMMAWQKGILIFRLETIEEIAPVLERFYNINIHIKASRQPDKQVSTSFARKALPQVLEVLSQTAGFNYTIKGKEIYIN